ncbi:transglycosylase SLT domain-containing protein [Streptococcus alactolyticus]|uniref:tape measure protein n=1 Tax=Streptococcus alactolyticus TaxID=29389 RepID=UPI00195782F6|nr:tape measure protein [Streptococcus alactolyticus]MBM6697508.1 transglycosylase SLT domain-containing protein [Streptococcus alactolyticus]
MANKINATMSTEIALDTLEASKSIKNLTQLVSSATSAWKAQETQLRQTGDNLGAAKAKYDGLSEAITRQQAKIDSLKREQSELKGNTSETAEQYLKYQRQIDQATTKLASMESQQQKAKSSLDYYKSGLAGLQQQFRQQNEASETYIKRLQAEGKENEANAEKSKLLKNSVENLTNQYKIQENMLEKVAAESGKTSDKYLLQKKRLDETATSLANAKNEQDKLNEEFRKANPTFFDKIRAKAKESADSMQELAEKATHTNSVLGSFREKLSFGAVAGLAQTAIQGVVSSLSGMTDEVTNTSDAIEKFQSTMNFAGKTKEETEEATKLFKKYADDTVYDLNDITNTGAQLAANGINSYKELAIAAGNLNAVAGGNADTFKSVGMVLTQTAGAGKLTTENWNQMADAIPGASGKLQEALKNMNAYTGDFRDAMADGQISAEEFLKAIQDLGSTDAAEEAARSTKTFEGAIGNLEATVTTGMTNVLDAFGKEKVTGTITKFGDIVAKAFEKVADGVKWMKDNMGIIEAGPLGRFVDTVKSAFGQVVDSFNKGKGAIGEFLGKLGTVGLNFSNTVWQVMADAVTGISKGFESISRNMKDSESPMNAFKSGFEKIVSLSDKFFRYISSHTKDITQIVSSVTEIVGLFAQGVWDTVSDAVKEIGKGFSAIFKNSKKSFDPISKLSGAVQELAKHRSAIKAIGSVFATYFIGTKVIAGFNAASAAIKVMAGNVITSFNAIKVAMMTNPFLIAVVAITALVAGFVELYKHNKKFRDFCNGIAKSIKDGIGGAIKWLKDKFSDLSKGWNNFKKSISKGTDNVVKTIKNGAKKVGDFFVNVGKTIKNVMTTIGKILIFANPVVLGFALMYKESAKFRKFVKGIVDIADDLKKGLSKKVDETKKTVSKTWDNLKKSTAKTWNGIKDDTHKSVSKLADNVKDTHDKIHDRWSKTWNKSKDFLSDRWDDINKTTEKKFGKNLKDLIFGKLDEIGNKFKDTWNGIKDGFRDMWNGLKELAGNGINAVIKIPNDGIDGINSLIHDFGGPKNAIGKIPKVKFANGTGFFNGYRNAITRPTLATLNDGNDSPETNNQEMVILPNGKAILPQGRNAQMLLPAGSEVLNASELAMLAGLNNRQAFAKGTGFWSKIWNTATDVAGSVWDGLKDGVDKFTKMLSFITDAVAHPIDTLAKKFNPKSDNLDGMFKHLGNALYKKTIENAKDWWKELWSMANEKASPEVQAGAIGDDYQFKDRAADSGADPWGYFFKECVSFVASRLANQGVNPSLFSHLGNGNMWLNARVPRSSTPRPGMVAVYAKNGQNHVSTVSGVSGDTFSGEEYNYAGSHAYHAFSGRPISMVDTFLDFGVHVADKAKEENSPLRKLIKNQVGGMFDWIAKMLAPLNMASSLDNPQGGSVERWRSYVEKALKANGIEPTAFRVSKILETIRRESNGDPNAINNWDSNAMAGHPSIGLMQTIGPTFEAYKHAGHNNIRNGYDNLLAAINYIKHRYGTSDAAFNRVAAYGYRNGGLVANHGVYELAEENKPEYVIPTDVAKRGRAWQLLSEAVARFAGEAPDDRSISASDASIAKLEAKFDTVISLLTQLVANGTNPIEVRNIIDGQSISNGLAPFMSEALNRNSSRNQIILGGANIR